MRRMLTFYCQSLQFVSVVLLAIMVGLVFGNVVLRYAFNSGITVSEELSRWLFVWLTFLGSTYALRERRHLGTDILIARFGPLARKVCLLAGYAAMLWMCWLLFSGALIQTRLNWHVTAPSSGLPLAWFYLSGIVFSVSAAAVLLEDAYAIMMGKERDGSTAAGGEIRQ